MQIHSIYHYNEDNAIEVYVHSKCYRYSGFRSFSLPCGLTTMKNPGPVIRDRKVVRYSYQDQVEDPSLNDYLHPEPNLVKVIEIEKKTYPNDPEIDHTDDVYLDDENHIIVVLHPAGVRQAKGFSGNDDWVLMIDNDGRICLKLAYPINSESIELEGSEYEPHEDDILF